jgi:hypothetical protein
MQGALSPSDYRELNAMAVSELRYIAEHNYMYFLILTNHSDLLRVLFFDKKEFAREVALIREMERLEQSAFQVQQNNALVTQTLLNQQQTPKMTNYWSQYPQGFIPIELLFYYEKELQQIHYRYHVRRFEATGNAMNQTLDVIDYMEENIKNNPKYSTKEKEEFTKWVNDIKEKKDEIMKRKTIRPNGSVDEEAVRQQSEDLVQLYEDVSQELTQKKKQYGHQDKRVANLFDKVDEIRQYWHQEIQEITEERDHDIALIQPYLEQSLEQSKADANKSLDIIIMHLDRGNLSSLNEKQIESYNKTVDQLKSLKNEMNMAKDYTTIQRLLQQSREATKNLHYLINPPVLGQEASHEVKEQSMYLHQMSISISDAAARKNNLSDILNNAHHQRRDDMVHAPKVDTGFLSTPQDSNAFHVKSNPHGAQINTSQEQVEPSQCLNTESIDNTIREKQSKFKSIMHESRPVDEAQQLKKDQTRLLKEIESLKNSIISEDDLLIVDEIAQGIQELIEHKHPAASREALTESIKDSIQTIVASNGIDVGRIEELLEKSIPKQVMTEEFMEEQRLRM